MEKKETKEQTAGMPPFFEVTGDWILQSAELKSKFHSLTDGDLKLEVGRENEMLKSMESRLHMTRAEVIAVIEDNRRNGK